MKIYNNNNRFDLIDLITDLILLIVNRLLSKTCDTSSWNFYQKILILFCNFRLQYWESSNECFLNKEVKSLKNTEKGVLILSETNSKHRKHIAHITAFVFAPAITSDVHRSIYLFCAIVSLICIYLYYKRSDGIHNYQFMCKVNQLVSTFSRKTQKV